MLHDKMQKLFEKKKKNGDELSPIEKEASMSALGMIHGEATNAMKNKVDKGFKKSPPSPDQGDSGTPPEEGSTEEEAGESLEEEMKEEGVSTPEEVDAKIAELEDLQYKIFLNNYK